MALIQVDQPKQCDGKTPVGQNVVEETRGQVVVHSPRLAIQEASAIKARLAELEANRQPMLKARDVDNTTPNALALLSFKSKADLHNNLHFPLSRHINYCQWQGVKCSQGKVIRLVLEGIGLNGVFHSNTLSQLDQLRVLSLQNNSLFGPIPDLSKLVNLKSLFLNHNYFSGYFPFSIISLHRLRTLDLSYNKLYGVLPTELTHLDRIYSLHFEWNRFNGSIPPLNQTSLQNFNVSGNNLTGSVPVTVVLSHFDASSFLWNPGLCGEIINKECHSKIPFFRSSSIPPPPVALGQNAEVQGIALSPPSSSSKKKNKKTPLIVGFSVSVSLLIIGFLLFTLFSIKRVKKQTGVTGHKNLPSSPMSIASESASASASATVAAEVAMRVVKEQEENELELKVKKMQGKQLVKSGNLMFCAGEAQVYNLDQLMRASAEMLGRGSIGTTYKAVLDNQLIVSVKRLDALKISISSKEMFQTHMESVGSLRHPNLVPVRAYFQAQEERLIVYDYQPNGSLFSLIHGSRSARAKPLHWTSCLKIAEDVVQGLAYIHQASRLIHGNLKSTNVLLGADFEACLTDYCLSVLTSSSHDDTESAGYKAPETRRSNSRITAKSDVYSFGILLLELLSGKPPSEHPFLVPEELSNWVQSVRDVEPGEENRLAMLVEVAITCSLHSPEQRPSMWQVMKMIQEIKETVMMEDNELANIL
ncbi:Inactive leucine-rich repeat receptor-like serine/threonine-protein kinase [Thalictrum thalictroides]|uniref:Inactive leucine-rich repeat receptor-like serine/threonine-protein kinase n=1 Tax=Thalictrum thalictroides TaxID=46969 RepID=A0A7J6WMC8_THATH|nr:Inactive leucine-rich repeat receptor-like serine/threonine-protein kinase [Thalictrum thalictroides]